MCKHAVKKLPFVIRYVPDRHTTQQICDKAIFENGGTLKSVPILRDNILKHNPIPSSIPPTAHLQVFWKK